MVPSRNTSNQAREGVHVHATHVRKCENGKGSRDGYADPNTSVDLPGKTRSQCEGARPHDGEGFVRTTQGIQRTDIDPSSAGRYPPRGCKAARRMALSGHGFGLKQSTTHKHDNAPSDSTTPLHVALSVPLHQRV